VVKSDATSAPLATKQQALERSLQDAIARVTLKPGARLKQQELARQFGVSPTPFARPCAVSKAMDW
jgi:DNA-binding GntR family transcriptional regulator